MEPNQESRSLIKASIISFAIAILALVFFILPAEYNLDPTGVGKQLGLTVFNGDTAAGGDSQISNNQASGEQNSVVLTVPAGKGIEYKLSVKQFKKVNYEWLTDGGEVYVDLHGEPAGDTTGYFESYAIATLPEMKGSFTAPFDGSHGWYWKNTSSKDMQIQLLFDGDYVIEGLK
ncbi:hypothetical protein SG34_018650 [Thalassomonas viridans]|uniref:Transmembrane anchor protein n=1 Tax=Thalassomonas viridans TaxID=137584 RepID=A0AAE9Z1B4_9GAMM|nr:hypothetical protein [Thalassomonas viridans]WDE03407.1 hypothetical protein SG34_018650 [Thalassomonas viridans]